MRQIRLSSSRMIGYGHSCFIVAEAGVNHNGDPQLAKRLVDVAVEARADAVKFQTFKSERVISPLTPKAAYQMKTTGVGESQLDMVKRLELSFDDFRELYFYCQQQGILFMSTPFDEESADFLADLGVTVLKVSSGEITNLPFLSHLARKGKPLIVSTGMACLGEVETAVKCINKAGNENLVLLHCVSSYPADPADANLRAMGTMAAAFGVPVGYSDHTLGIEVSLAAVALGACVIEKHFTLDRKLPGPDHQVSLIPAELRALVEGIRRVETALGHGRKEPSGNELEVAAVARKSLVAALDIPLGGILTKELIAVKRPGTGLPPSMLPQLLGRKVNRDIPAGTVLSWEMLT